MASEQATILDFFHKIWREEKAIVCLAFKNPESGIFSREYFEWPSEEIPVVQKVLSARTSQEVYFSPALFRERSSKKEAVLGSFCFWVEFDGTLPIEFEGLPKPNIVLQSSTETHQHIYWTSDTLIPVERLEAVNRSLTYKLGADASGWDANQVLRPPETLNHKKGLRTQIVSISDHYVNSVAFSENLPQNVPPQIELVGQLPDPKEFAHRYTFPNKVWDLFVQGVVRDRSAGLMNLGYSLAEMNMTNVEILAMLLHADNRWGKFAKRSDQLQRLTEIVTRARQKYPFKLEEQREEGKIISVGFSSLRAIEKQVTWLWDDIWYETGYFLLTGPSGVGKSQFSLDLGAHLVLGKDFLGKKVATKKVGFVSLEMNDIELKGILDHQVNSYSADEQKILEKNFHFVPRGYPLYLNRDENKLIIEEWIQREGIEVVIFDSLGSMTQELSKESDAKDLMDWNDRMRNSLGVSPVLIHHHRKAQVGNKNAKETSDIFGSYAITARATTTITLWDIRKKGLIEVIFRKTRMSALPKPWAINRKSDLTFEISDMKSIVSDEDFIDLEGEDVITLSEDTTTEFPL